MALRFFTREHAAHYRDRIGRLAPDAPPRFGTLSPTEMLAHLRFTFALSLGEESARDQSNLLTRTLIRWIFFHLVTTWPGGVIKAPPAFTPEPAGEFEAERIRLLDAMDRFLDALDREPDRRTLSPLLGPVTLRYWSRIHGIHLRHHLRQFGID